MARGLALFMVFTTPVCMIAGYVDTILSNPDEEHPSMKVSFVLLGNHLVSFVLLGNHVM